MKKKTDSFKIYLALIPFRHKSSFRGNAGIKSTRIPAGRDVDLGGFDVRIRVVVELHVVFRGIMIERMHQDFSRGLRGEWGWAKFGEVVTNSSNTKGNLR